MCIQYNCTIAPLEVNGVAYSWWNDKNGVPRYFWSGITSNDHICQCGIEKNCIESFMPCNCDSGLQIPLTDNGECVYRVGRVLAINHQYFRSGIITDKNILPITHLNFGRTILEGSIGLHTLGRLECTGQMVVNGMPKSCTDLWRIGHTLSGLFSVMGLRQIETGYCDFTKLPSDPSMLNNSIKLGEYNKLYHSYRFPEVDWICGRYIVARLFQCAQKC